MTAAGPVITYDRRFYSERKPHGMLATARVVDNKRQRAIAYLLDETSAASLALDLNHLEEFKAAMKNVVTMRDIVDNMLAIEAVQDMAELTKACDRNRELLYRLEIGPFMPTAHSPKVKDEEDGVTTDNVAAAQEDSPARENPGPTLWG